MKTFATTMTKSIKNILDSYFSDQENWKITLLKNWDSILGNLNKQVRLEKVYDDTVILGVYDGHWMQELYMLSHVLMQTINGALDKPRIKKIRFKLVDTKKAAGPIKQQKSVQPETQTSIIVSGSELKTLDTIKDPQLRSALYDFLMRCTRERS